MSEMRKSKWFGSRLWFALVFFVTVVGINLFRQIPSLGGAPSSEGLTPEPAAVATSGVVKGSAEAASVPLAASQAATPTVAPRTGQMALAQVGSEGYGPKVREALSGGSPEEALEAAKVVLRCRGIDRDVEAVYKMGQKPEMQQQFNKGYQATVDYVQSEQRRCQTLTPELLASRTSLLYKAVEGGEPGAAAAILSGDPSLVPLEAKQVEVASQALRRDGQSGDRLSLMLLAGGDEKLSGDPGERRVFKAAYQVITTRYPDGVETQLTNSVAEAVVKLGVSLSDFSFFSRDELTAAEKSRVASIVAAYEQRRPKPTRSGGG